MLDQRLAAAPHASRDEGGTGSTQEASSGAQPSAGDAELAKLLDERAVMVSLNLSDNHVHADGGKYFGRALKLNSALETLNLRLNRLGDEGGKMLLDGMLVRRRTSRLVAPPQAAAAVMLAAAARRRPNSGRPARRRCGARR